MTGLTDTELSGLLDKFNTLVIDTLIAPETRNIPQALADIGMLSAEQMALLWLQGITGFGPQGPPGPIGPQGPPGPEGMQGIQGLQGNVGPAGAQGPMGIPGQPGPAGATGSQGPPGPAGTPGAGVHILGSVPNAGGLPGTGFEGDAWLALDTGHLWVWMSQPPPGHWFDAGQFQGPPGVAGPQGPPGANGAAGAQGPPGPGLSLPVLQNLVLYGGPGNATAQSGNFQFDGVNAVFYGGAFHRGGASYFGTSDQAYFDGAGSLFVPYVNSNYIIDRNPDTGPPFGVMYKASDRSLRSGQFLQGFPGFVQIGPAVIMWGETASPWLPVGDSPVLIGPFPAGINYIWSAIVNIIWPQAPPGSDTADVYPHSQYGATNMYVVVHADVPGQYGISWLIIGNMAEA